MTRRVILGSLLILGVAVALVGLRIAAWSDIPKELRVSAIPDENPTELVRIYTPFVEYLSKELGIPVRYYNVVDYAATVEGMAAKKLDMVWYGGFTFVQTRKRTGDAIPLVSREEDLKFHSKFITRPETGIKSLADLKGKTFSFGSVSSTSGHLMPRYFLLQNGINPEKEPLLSPEERESMVRQVLAPFGNVEVKCFAGLTVNFVRSCGAAVMLRGLRTLTDIEMEFTMPFP